MIPYLVEFVGTFIFLSVIVSVGKPLPIAIALAAVIYFGGAISGGHFNPAVSVMMFLNKMITMPTLVGYVVAQVLGGVVALYFYNMNKSA
tara:strand:- start:5 stop:274 length:270 start_codon:yes stop_codon:yes gene_type:complete